MDGHVEGHRAVFLTSSAKVRQFGGGGGGGGSTNNRLYTAPHLVIAWSTYEGLQNRCKDSSHSLIFQFLILVLPCSLWEIQATLPR